LCAFSEGLHSPGPVRQGFLCGIADSKLRIYTFSAKFAPKSQKCCGKQEICQKGRPDARNSLRIHPPIGIEASMRSDAKQHERYRPYAAKILPGILRRPRIHCMVDLLQGISQCLQASASVCSARRANLPRGGGAKPMGLLVRR
jgi:hypothetical protein